MARLIFHDGNSRSIEYKLTQRRTTVGRADTCDILVPGTHVSRTHIVIDHRDGQFTIRDRSRHGTEVNGERIDSIAMLAEGDEIKVGEYRLVFTREIEAAAPTARVLSANPPNVQLVAVDEGIVVERLVLVVEAGPAEGAQLALKRALSKVGGPSGSAHVIIEDVDLCAHHFSLEVVRGRAMITPAEGAVILDGERLSQRMPVYRGEPVRVGETVFRLETEVVNDQSLRGSFGEMVGEAEVTRRMFGVLRRMAAHNAPVLLFGESGTGKELAAKGLHANSKRTEEPFVALNCGAIGEALFESELFGHEKGAFTGASQRRDGAFHRADKGTLFLDEIGEIPEACQAKLLRTLESGEVRRVGGSEIQYPDVRVVVATNKNLEEMVAAGTFRKDLFFRLAVLAVRIPPLRDRMEDLELLCRVICRVLGPDTRVSDEAMELLRTHAFPGNVRELRNVLTRAVVLGGPVIHPQAVSFSPWGFEGVPETPASLDALEEAERKVLVDSLMRHEGNRSAVARELNIARSTLLYKMRKLGVDDMFK